MEVSAEELAPAPGGGAGELKLEIERGAWYVLGADASLALREPRGLWEELMLREQRMGSMRTTAHRR